MSKYILDIFYLETMKVILIRIRFQNILKSTYSNLWQDNFSNFSASDAYLGTKKITSK